jgi:universal stress protein A
MGAHEIEGARCMPWRDKGHQLAFVGEPKNLARALNVLPNGQRNQVPFNHTSNQKKTMNTLTKTSQPSGEVRSEVSRIPTQQDEPVKLAPAGLKLKSILVPIDFSRISRKALDYAVPLAKHFGARITLLHVREPPPYSADLTYVPMGEGFPLGPTKKELHALAKNTIEPELLKTVLVRVGTAFEVITNVAHDCEADLIVITTHGYTGLKHVFMGSTAERSSGTPRVRYSSSGNANTSSCRRLFL